MDRIVERKDLLREQADGLRKQLEDIDVELDPRAPRLDRALHAITRSGGEVVLIDDTLVCTKRRTGRQNRRNYSGKHKAHGLLFLAVTDERGNLPWISAAKPGRASDLTAARHDKICAKLRAANEHGFADLKNWRTLTTVRMNATHATTLLRSLLVLTRAKITR
ncbi:transposase family protein [Kitasatospora sp. MMS16-BH015]|uniref:transposase family protein n=1 Tax=Kitasatospora sp. MMS16-BH015 TaxID=2018025 RepID=UPI00131A5715|nr:transposase family protein [Kitasatospora sp. MMS16-BH015]